MDASDTKKAQPRMLYVVTARSLEKKISTNELKNDWYGVLRVFSNKEDAKAYMLHHYKNTDSNCSISMYETKNGLLRMTYYWCEEECTDADKKTTRSEELKCETIELTGKLELDYSTVMDDMATVLYGL